MSKLILMTAAAAGYVLGARAGRERYEQIATTTRSVMRNPKVQSARQQTQAVAAEKASAAGTVAAEKARQAAATVSDKVSRNGSDSTDGPGSPGSAAGTRAGDPASTTAPPLS